MKRTTKVPPDTEQESSESDVDSELERQSRPRGRRRTRGGGPKQRVVWLPEMHADFEAAVADLGGAFCATPKAILEHMGSEGFAGSLSVANVKSHLQKYRLKEQKRMEEEEAEAVAAAAACATSSLATTGGHAGGRSGGGFGAVPPVAAVLRGSPGMPTLSPGMVPMNAIGSGEQPALAVQPALPLPPTSAHSAALSSAAGLYLAPHNVAPQPLAIGQSAEDVPFADEQLGRQAAAWRRKQQVLAAQAAALQQAAGPPSQPQQLALILLQRENLKCLQALHALHLAQMQLHLDAAQRLKEQAGAADAGWQAVEVKQEQKPSTEAIQEVLAAACMNGTSDSPTAACGAGASGSPAEGSEGLDSPAALGDAPVAMMEE